MKVGAEEAGRATVRKWAGKREHYFTDTRGPVTGGFARRWNPVGGEGAKEGEDGPTLVPDDEVVLEK